MQFVQILIFDMISNLQKVAKAVPKKKIPHTFIQIGTY